MQHLRTPDPRADTTKQGADTRADTAECKWRIQKGGRYEGRYARYRDFPYLALSGGYLRIYSCIFHCGVLPSASVVILVGFRRCLLFGSAFRCFLAGFVPRVFIAGRLSVGFPPRRCGAVGVPSAFRCFDFGVYSPSVFSCPVGVLDRGFGLLVKLCVLRQRNVSRRLFNCNRSFS